MKRSTAPLAVVSLVLCFATRAAPQTGITVQFLARGMEPRNSDAVKSGPHDPSKGGHVFMIVTIHTNHGPKEEVYGFYKNEAGEGLIKGPGMLRSEFRCGPNDDCDPHKSNLLKRFSEVKDSVTISINEDQRRKIAEDVSTWDTRNYHFFKRNCMDFVNTVVKDLGFPTPERRWDQTPMQYLSELRSKVDGELARRKRVEQERRDAEEREQERQRREAAERERQRREAEERERQRREEEARRIPPGWVPCSCPNIHAPHGKYVNGTLYHPDAYRCPR